MVFWYHNTLHAVLWMFGLHFLNPCENQSNKIETYKIEYKIHYAKYNVENILLCNHFLNIRGLYLYQNEFCNHMLPVSYKFRLHIFVIIYNTFI